jgi:hypothetical protein
MTTWGKGGAWWGRGRGVRKDAMFLIQKVRKTFYYGNRQIYTR